MRVMLVIERTQFGDIAVLVITGRLDAINAPQLRRALEILHDNGGEEDLILDMRGVNYLSAAALRVLRMLKERTGHVRISEPSERVREVMQITGLDQRYELFDNRLNALHATKPIVNAHTHLEWGWLEPYCPDVRGKPYLEWWQSVEPELTALKSGWEVVFRNAIESGIAQLRAAGVTTVGDVSTTGLSIEPLMRAGMHGVVYIEVARMADESEAEALKRAHNLIDRWRPQLNDRLRLGLSVHKPYLLSRGQWEDVVAYSAREELPLCIHVAEHPDEFRWMRDGQGPLVELQRRGRGLQVSPLMTPINYLESLGVLDRQPLLIHVAEVDDTDLELIRETGCTVVHCPRSNLRLHSDRMPLERFIKANIPVLLGTESLASTPTLNILEEVEVAAALHHQRIEPEALTNIIHGQLPG